MRPRGQPRTLTAPHPTEPASSARQSPAPHHGHVAGRPDGAAPTRLFGLCESALRRRSAPTPGSAGDATRATRRVRVRAARLHRGPRHCQEGRREEEEASDGQGVQCRDSGGGGSVEVSQGRHEELVICNRGLGVRFF